MASKRPFSNRDFLDWVRDYLPTDATVHETRADGHAGAAVSHQELNPNTFYLFDADALDGFCHAIGELALEEANGTVLAALQDFGDFEQYRECVAQLASTIDRVELVGTGRVPPNVRRVKFIKDARGTCRSFRVVLYEGRRLQVMLACRELGSSSGAARKPFVGLYTLDAQLIKHLHAELVDVAQGRGGALRGFMRLQAIDLAAKQIQQEFLRENEALNQAMHRLQFDPANYRPAQFALDLEKGLSRLQEWKRRLPELVARAEAT